MNKEILKGRPYPLGTTFDGQGTNFALFSAGAERVELCLFNQDYGQTEHAKIELNKSNDVWHCYLPEVGPGQRYGYRVHGPFLPLEGLRFNSQKLLLDPYARAITGKMEWHESLYGYCFGADDADLSFSELDSAAYAPKAVVIDDRFDWQDDQSPMVDERDAVIYELHVKGFSMLNPKVPENLRGTYAGLGHPASVSYLKSLGVTSVELMPVHHFLSDHSLEQKGLSNYWGYNTLGYFAPHAGYCSIDEPGAQVSEFKSMVRALHAAGIEVILDVVFNHSAEGNQMGPTLSFRGIDNVTYYRLEEQQRYYTDFTGTGNTLNTVSKNVMRLVMDSLRYWVSEMHVDGFRFDLAATLARSRNSIDHDCLFFGAIHQDPILSQVKLIAEPWDIGEDGYQLGRFSKPWSEWNGKFRDSVRTFWNTETANGAEFSDRLLGSEDIYRPNGRLAVASINFVTAHDGFTLLDLLSYSEKRNLANGEDNHDGENDNISWNCGDEGNEVSTEVSSLRAKQQRNILMTLLLSKGIPMITAGDELGRSQQGNNNAYCQDNELSYLHWEKADFELSSFVAEVIAIRNRFEVLRRSDWLSDSKYTKIRWLGPLEECSGTLDGNEQRCFGLLLEGMNGDTLSEPENGRLLLVFNATMEDIVFKLPAYTWQQLANTDKNDTDQEIKDEITMKRKSMRLLWSGDIS